MAKVDYPLLSDQIRALAEISNDLVPVLSNASALLYDTLPDVNWAGFYLRKTGPSENASGADGLLLGPFQGKPACVWIENGKGVCGTALQADRIQRVPDVHQFPGHIACDSASRSEIVLPIHEKSGQVTAVLDIDSPLSDCFSKADEEGLAAFVKTLEEILY